MGDATVILGRLRDGDPDAAEELFGVLYPQLRNLAGAVFRSQKANHTLQPTALVHEAYIKMMKPGAAWEDRAHFCSVAAKAMRQILVNHARDRAALKRGGGAVGRSLTVADAIDEGGQELDILALHEALEELARLDERQAKIAELRFFGGLANKEVAEALGVSLRTVELDWSMAKGWLASRLG
ncbi:MAG: sigma-70 family RNA polymerase sigma factor [Planctomycetota bacterium]|jgi:RNA polymerase sigma factor (TIGR02999 family)